jgi:hypothetical protein
MHPYAHADVVCCTEANDACRATEREKAQADTRREAAEKALVRERQAWFDNSQRMREQLQAALDKAQTRSGERVAFELAMAREPSPVNVCRSRKVF